MNGDVTIVGEWLQITNLSLCSAPKAFKPGGIYIVPLFILSPLQAVCSEEIILSGYPRTKNV